MSEFVLAMVWVSAIGVIEGLLWLCWDDPPQRSRGGVVFNVVANVVFLIWALMVLK